MKNNIKFEQTISREVENPVIQIVKLYQQVLMNFVDSQNEIAKITFQAIRSTANTIASVEKACLSVIPSNSSAAKQYEKTRVHAMSSLDRVTVPAERLWGLNEHVSLFYHHSLSHSKSLSNIAILLLEESKQIMTNLSSKVNLFAYWIEYWIKYKEEFIAAKKPNLPNCWKGSIIVSEQSEDLNQEIYWQSQEWSGEEIVKKLNPNEIARLDIYVWTDGFTEIWIFTHPLRRGKNKLQNYHLKICPYYKRHFDKIWKEYNCPCWQHWFDNTYIHNRTIGRWIWRALIAMTPRLIEKIIMLHPELPKSTTAFIIDTSEKNWTSAQLQAIWFKAFYDIDIEEYVAKKQFTFNNKKRMD